MFNKYKVSMMIFYKLLSLLSISTGISAYINDRNNYGIRTTSWSYSDIGSWGKKCKNGKMQSPIHIEPNTTISAGYKKFHISNADSKEFATIYNNGHTVQILFPKSKIILSGGGLLSSYRIDNIHFHWGGEHTIASEQRAVLEVHLVFYDVKYKSTEEAAKNKGFTVLAVLVDNVTQCDPSNSWTTIGNQISDIIKANGEASLQRKIKIEDFLPSSRSFYRYIGSLTTPDCTENILWNVFESRISVCNRIVDAISSIHDIYGKRMESTSRPLQPLNGRQIFRYVQH